MKGLVVGPPCANPGVCPKVSKAKRCWFCKTRKQRGVK